MLSCRDYLSKITVFFGARSKKLSTMWEKMEKSGIKWEFLYYFYIPLTEGSL